DEDILRHALGLLTDDVRAATSTGVVKSRYSHTEKRSYLSNGCFHCDMLLGNFHLYHRELREAIEHDALVTIARGAVGWAAVRDFLVPDNTWAGAVLHYDPTAAFFDGRLHGPLSGQSWEFDLSEWRPPLGGRPR
ncbi:hypothetical protein K7G98_15410, partial [Saccharothrix sp. MB29]|nr:hypothetical protein [Saccharothrix sp. MB29]